MKDKQPKMATGRFTISDKEEYPLLGEDFDRKFYVEDAEGKGKRIMVPYGVLDKAIGRGGFASVYRLAFDKRHPFVSADSEGEKYYGAVKVLSRLDNKELISRFKREGRIGVHLNEVDIPESLVKVYEFFESESNGQWYIVMEHVPDSVTLSNFVDTDPQVGVDLESRLGFENSCIAIDGTIKALNYAHERGIAHRDLKPENVMWNPDVQKAKLIDFGLGSMKGVKEEELYGIQADIITRDQVTQDEDFRGTPHYASPESAQGKMREFPFEIDVWGIGALAYALFAGRSPYIGPSSNVNECLAILSEIKEEEPLFLREVEKDIPWPINDFVMRCLEKETRKRMKNWRLKFEWDNALKESGVKLK